LNQQTSLPLRYQTHHNNLELKKLSQVVSLQKIHIHPQLPEKVNPMLQEKKGRREEKVSGILT
jgi:hypothetical protein